MSAPRPERFHTVVVGAGSGGLTVAVGLARLGRAVALVEDGEIGGDCTNVGCIPSKTLIELARSCARERSEELESAAREALAETRRRRDALRVHEEGWLAGLDGITLVRGRARLTRGNRRTPEVLVESRDGDLRSLQADRVVLATGSRALVPPVPGLQADARAGAEAGNPGGGDEAGSPGGSDEAGSRGGTDEAHAVLTNATLFDLRSPPAHLAVIGAGSIGCEMAFAFTRLGSRVTLIEMADRVLPASEPEASAVVSSRLAALGVGVITGSIVRAHDASSRSLVLARTAATVGATETAGAHGAAPADVLNDVERVLVAVGRRPNSDGLGLEDIGIRVDGRGAVEVDGAYRTSTAGVYAIGDLIGGGFTHVAHAQGRRLVRYLSLPLPLLPEGDHSHVAFTEPEVGQVGPTLEQLRRRWHEDLLSVHKVALRDTDRGLTQGLEDGFVQLVAMRGSGRLLAATVVAAQASEILPVLTWAQRRRVPLWQLTRMEVAYPALSEAVRLAADQFVFGSLPRLHRDLGTYLRRRWNRPRAG